MSKVFRLIGKAVSQHARDHGVGSRILFRFSRKYYHQYMNASFDPNQNGEYSLLSTLRDFNVEVAFDVGANDGDHVQEMCTAFPKSKIFAFEMDTEIFGNLENRFQNQGDVNAYNIGLGDKLGEFTYFFNSAGNHSGTTMFYDPDVRPNAYAHEQRTAKFITGDYFCSEQKIDKIDFLKVDTEGADFIVLKGFGGMFSDKKIRVLQFEYNFHALNARVFLYDFYKFLEPFDYKVGRLFPNGVNFSTYSVEHEGLKGMYVAVLSSEHELIKTLSCDAVGHAV